MRIKARKAFYWQIVVDCGDGRTIIPVLVTRNQLRRLNSIGLNEKYFLNNRYGRESFWVMRTPHVWGHRDFTRAYVASIRLF
jgi:hypothetical protein